MKFLKHIELSRDLIDKLKTYFPIKIFKSHSHLFYEGQIPISGYLIIDGTIQVSKKNKLKRMLSQGTLIGLVELLNKIPSSVSVEVYPNTVVCFLDKSTLIELKNSDNGELATIIEQSFEVIE